MPTVSIITPLYNKVGYIIDTIRSVLSQSYSDWEMLIVDNGSTDGSWKKAQQIQDDRIRLLQSPNQGPGAARNYGLIQARGEWIQFLDADDLLEPDHLENQLATAQQNPDAEIIAGWWQEFTDENPTVRTLKYPAGIGQPAHVLRDAAIAFAPWTVHAALVRRSALSPDFYWPEQLDQYLGEDIAFWFRLIGKCTVAYGESKGALYRTQTFQCRNQCFNPEKWFQGVHAALEWNLHYLASKDQQYTPTQSENLMRVYSGLYLLARAKNSTEIQSQALAKASQWLESYFQVADRAKVSMLVRRFLGLKLFLNFANSYREG
ncbi:MAG: glycosyltransferase [Aphanothece sp. CMT-3BRIN-NPC111]|jgi:glycosyltransferase involved in cell wall biosynthesis|nr:glycosyltransferase [Aphanothece sp. CMT-3BRIN-NPC111]